MLKVTLCLGIPASGKSTWAKEEVRKNPEKVTRVNRDDLRAWQVNNVKPNAFTLILKPLSKLIQFVFKN